MAGQIPSEVRRNRHNVNWEFPWESLEGIIEVDLGLPEYNEADWREVPSACDCVFWEA